MKIALGTVQFGTTYGAFNSAGQVSAQGVADILDLAQRAGIDTLDTASGYGTSEAVLGDLAAGRFQLITKCPPLESAAEIETAFARSQGTLGQPIYGYLLHNAQDLLGPQGDAIWAALDNLRSAKHVQRIGVSAYSLDEARKIAERYDISLVQLPANILVPWYKDAGLPAHIEVHVRSVFLQGFLLSDPDALPARFAPWRRTLMQFRAQATQAGLTPLQACLAPLLASPVIRRVVLGVDSAAQLQDILDAVQATSAPPELGPFPDVTDALTDPRNW